MTVSASVLTLFSSRIFSWALFLTWSSAQPLTQRSIILLILSSQAVKIASSESNTENDSFQIIAWGLPVQEFLQNLFPNDKIQKNKMETNSAQIFKLNYTKQFGGLIPPYCRTFIHSNTGVICCYYLLVVMGY